MNISVFGGNGFIGSNFVKLYGDRCEVVSRGCNIPESSNVLYLISTVDNYNVHSDLKIDINTNLIKLMDVLNEIKQHPDRDKFIFNFVSSWFVYGQNHEIPFREDYSKCTPTGFYSITKHCAEQLLISFCETFDIKYRIFRLANVLGEGDYKISKQKNALQFLIKEIVHNRDVPLYYGGDVLRDYIYVEDVCNAMMKCMDVAPTNQIINIGSGIPSRFIDLINHAKNFANSESSIIHIEPTTFHNIVQVRHSYLDTTKLESYGFRCSLSPLDVVEKLVNHYKINV